MDDAKTLAPSDAGIPQGVKSGRRAVNRNFKPVPSSAEVESASIAPAPPVAPRPQGPRRQAGWSEPGNGITTSASPAAAAATQPAGPAAAEPNMQLSGVSRRKAAQIAAQEDRLTLEPVIQQAPADDFDAIMDIPELDAQEDISRQIASAPTVRTAPVINIAELESADLFRLPTVDKDHEIDLSLLTAYLCPADQVTEDSMEWDYDLLLAEIASELNAEKAELQRQDVKAAA